jgi:hypothetical protein
VLCCAVRGKDTENWTFTDLKNDTDFDLKNRCKLHKKSSIFMHISQTRFGGNQLYFICLCLCKTEHSALKGFEIKFGYWNFYINIFD